ncbi:MAG: dephospho-CoA kinase, partial [Bacteroidia bacterium]|nr:dephospho-CoA kinase [Bacteroidia bacterium]
MKIIGLTGGIGSGKSTVAGYFKQLGVPVFDADLEAKKLMKEDKELRQQIMDLFGNEAYKEDILNREYIAGRVFQDSELLE